MNCDEEVEFTNTSATNTNKKLKKVLFGVKVTVGRNAATVLAIVLEGLHFDVLLGVTWLKEAKAKILVREGVIKVNGELNVYSCGPILHLLLQKMVSGYTVINLPSLLLGKFWAYQSAI